MKRILIILFFVSPLFASAQMSLTISGINQCPGFWVTCNGVANFEFSDTGINGDYHVYLYQGNYGGSNTVLDSMVFTANSGLGTFDSLCPFSYFILIVNALGDSVHQTFGLAPPAMWFNVIDSTSFSGNIHCFAMNGTPPYQYSMNNGLTFQTSSVFTGLAPGPYPTYLFIIKDANGCLSQLTGPLNYNLVAAIPNVCNLQVNATSTGATDYQTSDGTIDWSFSTIYPGITHTIKLQGPDGIVYEQIGGPGINSGTFSAIPPALNSNYSLWVTNDSVCYSSAGINVDYPMAETHTFQQTCDSCSGVLTVNILESTVQTPYSVKLYDVSGSIPVLAYTGIGSGNWQYVVNICSGEYSMIVTNSAGDSVVQPFIYNYQEVAVAVVNVEHTTLGNNLGSIEVNANGGIAPYYYSFNETGPWQPISLYQNLYAGNYTLFVKDSLGCTSQTNAVINENLDLEKMDNRIVIYPNPTQHSIYVKVAGNFSCELFDITGNAILSTIAINETILNVNHLAAGTYILKVKDDQGIFVKKILVQ